MTITHEPHHQPAQAITAHARPMLPGAANTATCDQIARMLTATTGVTVPAEEVVTRFDGYFVHHLDRARALTLAFAILAAFESDPESGIPSVDLRRHGSTISLRLHIAGPRVGD